MWQSLYIFMCVCVCVCVCVHICIYMRVYIYIYIYIYIYLYMHVYMCIDLDIRRSNRSVKDMKGWTTYQVDSFIVVKFCVEPETLLEYNRMVHQCAIDSPEQLSGFEFRVFPSPKPVVLPKLECIIYFTHSWIYIYIYSMINKYILVFIYI